MTARKEHEESGQLDRRGAIAAGVFAGLAFLVVAFQLALAAGAPWGRFAMGGAFPERLPPTMRVAAFAQALVIFFFGAIVAVRARLIGSWWWHAISRKLVWLVVAYTVAGTVLNAITPSPWERTLWLPVVVILGISAVVVARTA